MILISAIIILIPFIIYTSTRTDEPYLLFGVLNENKEMGNYPTNASVGETLTFYTIVEDHGYKNTMVQIRMLTGKNTSVILGPNGSQNGILIQTQNMTLNDEDRVISEKFEVSFSEKTNSSEHEIVVFELWINENNEWEYYDILFIRIDVI